MVKKLDSALMVVLEYLIADKPLITKYKDHPLHGDYSDCRDCHIVPDLVLIYKKIDNEILQLIRLGSHSELF